MRRFLFPALVGLAVYFAVFGGEHSLFDVHSARRSIAADSTELQAMRQEIDSLRARADSLESDAVALERLAREDFGMIRDGEVLYRFAEPPDPAEEDEDAR